MILYRYFAREVLYTMVTVSFIVLIISMGWRFSGYLNEAARGVLSSDILFLLMAYRLPGFLELIVPISFFLALMLAYGRMYVDSEMVILESCGLGPGRLVAVTLVLSLIVMTATATISVWLKPAGEHGVETLLAGQRNMTEFDTLAPGRFQTIRSGKRVTYTESLTGEGNLENVFINEFQGTSLLGPRDVSTVIAEFGETQVDPQGNRFLVLKNGTRYSGEPGQPGYQVIEYEEYGQLIQKEQASKRRKRLSAIPTLELLSAEDSPGIAELHWRMAMVLMIPVMGLMAIPLSRVNPRQGRFTKLIPGMFLCFVYVVSLSGAKAGVDRGDLPIEYGLWWIHGIFIVITAAIFKFTHLRL
jgi:lipopolysaccharide export system permease protein